VPEIKDGQALARVKYLSIDPTMRVWMVADTYLPIVPIGEVMRAAGFRRNRRVAPPRLQKRRPHHGPYWSAGLCHRRRVREAVLPESPEDSFCFGPVFLGVLGFNGLTAFFGMEIAAPKKGETLVVSAAAGATGSIAGQIGKIHGCRVVGIAGTDDKCAWITQDLGFDAAVNYKHADWKKNSLPPLPTASTSIFENVGGEIMREV